MNSRSKYHTWYVVATSGMGVRGKKGGINLTRRLATTRCALCSCPHHPSRPKTKHRAPSILLPDNQPPTKHPTDELVYDRCLLIIPTCFVRSEIFVFSSINNSRKNFTINSSKRLTYNTTKQSLTPPSTETLKGRNIYCPQC